MEKKERTKEMMKEKKAVRRKKYDENKNGVNSLFMKIVSRNPSLHKKIITDSEKQKIYMTKYKKQKKIVEVKNGKNQKSLCGVCKK